LNYARNPMFLLMKTEKTAAVSLSVFVGSKRLMIADLPSPRQWPK